MEPWRSPRRQGLLVRPAGPPRSEVGLWGPKRGDSGEAFFGLKRAGATPPQLRDICKHFGHRGSGDSGPPCAMATRGRAGASPGKAPLQPGPGTGVRCLAVSAPRTGALRGLPGSGPERSGTGGGPPGRRQAARWGFHSRFCCMGLVWGVGARQGSGLGLQILFSLPCVSHSGA